MDGKCCECGITRQELEPKKPALRCTCGCLRGDHFGRPRACIPHGFHAFVCDHTRCGWKPREDRKDCPRRHPDSGLQCLKDGALFHMEHVNGDVVWDDRDQPEPPLTPEEEEELPPPEGPEYTPCVCGHIEPEHRRQREGWTREACLECDCVDYRTKPDFELPPQPDRRPPFAVGYSVLGHLYEVALPGDATVKAVDGVLVIQHALGPVAGIVQVLPVTNKESSDAQLP